MVKETSFEELTRSTSGRKLKAISQALQLFVDNQEIGGVICLKGVVFLAEGHYEHYDSCN